MLKFDSFSSQLDPGFWEALSKNKIDTQRLEDTMQLIGGSYSKGRSIISNSKSYGLPPRMTVNFKATLEDTSPGVIKNLNTLNEFKTFDKAVFLRTLSSELWGSIIDGRALQDPSLLTSFGLITFADLKTFKYYYWFAFPALMPPSPYEASAFLPLSYTNDQLTVLQEQTMPFFLVKLEKAKLLVAPLGMYETFFDGEIIIAFADPSSSLTSVGWPLRNLLILVQQKFTAKKVTIIALRDTDSLMFSVDIGYPCNNLPLSVGWELGLKSQKPSPRMTNLASLMDPKKLAESAVDLNLKLMKWRLLPSLDLDKISRTKCLLLGAGTLGCYVARILMAWGVREISFVDNGVVSFSNPVRQPLYEYKDCLDGGKPKAQTAAEMLAKVYPGVKSLGYNFSIPMPGHFIDSEEKTEERIEKLKTLIGSHDAVFLLTDSRESRWLPTLLGAHYDKIVINAALGFDSFLVMRHGIKNVPIEQRLGCYFCNDVVAPVDSLSNRTLDQQCTVTRPGLSGLASAVAVELLCSILNHPDGVRAKADALNDEQSSLLGIVPHQIRGFLCSFSNLILTGRGYDKCTACSDSIQNIYKEDGNVFLLRALRDPNYLEEVAGLTKMKEEMLDRDFDWTEDE